MTGFELICIASSMRAGSGPRARVVMGQLRRPGSCRESKETSRRQRENLEGTKPGQPYCGWHGHEFFDIFVIRSFAKKDLAPISEFEF